MHRLALSAQQSHLLTNIGAISSKQLRKLSRHRNFSPVILRKAGFSGGLAHHMSRDAAPTSAATGSEAAPSDPILQYVILRKDLWKEMKWPLGSVVAQGCHAATAALWLSKDQPITQIYCAPENINHMHKVCA